MTWLCTLTLAACAGPGPAPSTPDFTTASPPPQVTLAEGTAAATSTAAPSPTPSPTAVPRVFTIGLVQTPQTLDPAEAVDESALIITRHLYDGLTAFQPGTTLAQPALAERWTTSPDGLTWTFDLRQGVAFSDGTPLTAEATRLNFERWLQGKPPGPYTFWRALFGGFAGEAGPDGEPLSLVASVAARGATTLVITLTRPSAALPNTLAMPSFALVSPAALTRTDIGAALDSASAGTGPYVLASWPQPDLVRLTRSPDHWDPTRRDGPDELIFKLIPDDTQRLLALQAGEIEGLAHLNPSDYASAAAEGSGMRVAFDPPLNVLYLGFNQAHAPWANLECRLAVAHALDRDRYVRDFFPGDAQVAAAMQPPEVWGYSAAGERAYDPAQARQHWEACMASGVVPPPEIGFYVPPVARPYLPDPAGLGAAIQADLAAVGITVTVISPDWQTTWLPDVHSGRADLFLLGWTGVNGDPDSFLCPLFCGAEPAFNADNLGQPLAPDADLAALLHEAQTVTDPDRRATLYAQVHARVFEVVPAVPLAHRRTAWAYRSDIIGNVPSPIESVFFGLAWAP
jgi:peptide/nickel transport system substrate-binding protein